MIFWFKAENVKVENSMRYIIDDDTIEKLDVETAKRMVSSCLLKKSFMWLGWTLYLVELFT